MQKRQFILAILLLVSVAANSQRNEKDSSFYNSFYEMSVSSYIKSSSYQGDSIYVESVKNVTDVLPTHINGIKVLVVGKVDLKKVLRSKKTIRILRFEYPVFGKDFVFIKLGVYDLSMADEKYLYGKVEGFLLKVLLPCLSGYLKTETRLTDQ